jgi:NTP pyrophosphatase (non-canonical NTP hydrolase)
MNDKRFIDPITGDLVSPWHPMTDPVDRKITGKALEELGECISAIARCQIQGIDEREPVTGKLNRQWLEEEIADVLASIGILAQHFKLSDDRIAARIEGKTLKLQRWHEGA